MPTLALPLGGLDAALARLVGLSGDLSPVTGAIARHLETSVDRRFEREQAPGGATWPKSIRARKTGGRTLTDTARLRQSITSDSDATTARVGTNVVYAAIHQFGGQIDRQARTQTVYRSQKAVRDGDFRFVKKRKSDFAQDFAVGAHVIKMPARPFLGVDADDATAISDIILSAIADGWGAGS